MDDVSFEWDAVKAELNEIKHGVRFEEATTAFYDHYLVTFFDEDYSDYEDRFLSIGFSDQYRLLLIVHTDRDDVIRLISCRLATSRERLTYEQTSRRS